MKRMMAATLLAATPVIACSSADKPREEAAERAVVPLDTSACPAGTNIEGTDGDDTLTGTMRDWPRTSEATENNGGRTWVGSWTLASIATERGTTSRNVQNGGLNPRLGYRPRSKPTVPMNS